MSDRPAVVFLHPSNELYGADRSLVAMVRGVGDIARPVILLPDDLPYRGGLETALRESGFEVLVGPLPVVRRQYLRVAALPFWMFRSLRGSFWVLRVCRSHRAQALVSNTTGVLVGPLIAAILRKPHLWYVREMVVRPNWFRGLVRGASMIPGGRVVAVSNAVATWLAPIRGRGPTVVHNGVDIPETTSELPEHPTALFVGRLNSWKGHEVFLEAASQLHGEYPSFRFRIVGGAVPGDLETARFLEKRIADLGNQEWLSWAGEVPDARAEIREAWVVVVPSTRPDPFPNVVLEAMSEGRPVVGSRLGGIPEMVTDGVTGTLVQPADPRILAGALEVLLGNRTLARGMGAAGRARAQAEFSRALSREKWRKVFEQVALQAPGNGANAQGSDR